MHDTDPEARREAGRKGGRARSNSARALKALPEARLSATQLVDVLSQTIADVRAGTIDAGVGNAVATLARASIAAQTFANVTIPTQEALDMMDKLAEAVLASDPPDELRERIRTEFVRLVGLHVPDQPLPEAREAAFRLMQGGKP